MLIAVLSNRAIKPSMHAPEVSTHVRETVCMKF